jgi:hypothetical protein
MSNEDQKEDGSVEIELNEDAGTAPVVEEKVVAEAAAPPAEKAKNSEDAELEQYSDNVRRRIEKLTYKAREFERQRDAAVEYAKSLKHQVETADSRSSEYAKTLTTEYENRIQAQEQLVNERLRRAIDRGDIDDQIFAQRALAELTVEKQQLKGGFLKPPVERGVAQPAFQPTPQPAQVQPVRPDPKAELWAEKNAWFGADQPMTLTAFSHHRDLVEKEDFDPTTDDYYEELDKRMRRDFPHKFQQPQRNTPPQTVAPARVPARSDNVQKIKLKPSEVAIAKRLGVKLEDYARQVKKLQGNV